jgi:hypothetical protein
MVRFYQLFPSAIFYIFSFAFRGFPSAGWIFSLPVVKLSDLAGRKTLERVGNTVKRITTSSYIKKTRCHFWRHAEPEVPCRLLKRSVSTEVGHRRSLEVKTSKRSFFEPYKSYRPTWSRTKTGLEELSIFGEAVEDAGGLILLPQETLFNGKRSEHWNFSFLKRMLQFASYLPQ